MWQRKGNNLSKLRNTSTVINNKSITLPEQTLRQLHHSTMTPIQQAALDAANSKNKDDYIKACFSTQTYMHAHFISVLCSSGLSIWTMQSNVSRMTHNIQQRVYRNISMKNINIKAQIFRCHLTRVLSHSGNFLLSYYSCKAMSTSI